MAKGFLSILEPLDAQRLQKSVKATVQNSGRLTFAMDAVKDMKLDETKSIIILAANDNSGDLGAVISEKGDPEAFALKKCGAYFYVSFKNYLQQNGIEYKKQRIIYDITELDEKYRGKTLYKFERRIIKKGTDEDVEAERGETEVAAEAQQPAATPSDAATGASAALEQTEASKAVPAPQNAEQPTDPAEKPPEQPATADLSDIPF